MSTMIKGDMSGWKGIEFADGEMNWYCGNKMCQEQMVIDMREWMGENGYSEDEIRSLLSPRIEDAGQNRSPLAFQNNGIFPMSPRWKGGFE